MVDSFTWKDFDVVNDSLSREVLGSRHEVLKLWGFLLEAYVLSVVAEVLALFSFESYNSLSIFHIVFNKIKLLFVILVFLIVIFESLRLHVDLYLVVWLSICLLRNSLLLLEIIDA